jgi:flavin-dependent dehydrogenase
MSGSFDVIVIGGGPAGSTVASFLQQMGHRPLVLEREVFPRHHIGESMIAATIDVLSEIGLEEKLAAAGFPVKSGGCFLWGDKEDPWCIRFDEIPGRPTSYQVKRSVFDTLLLEHCASLGVDVRQGHRVTDVLTEDGRVTGVRFRDPDGLEHEAHAAYTVDASGLPAIVANRLSRRAPVEELKNMCLYGYWAGDHPAPAGLGGEIRPADRYNIIVKMLDEGWLWFIPLGGGEISVGFVAPRDNLPESGGKAALESFYHDRIGSTPEWQYLLSQATYTGEFHTIKDWSYRSEAMAGPGYFAVGDAACFVDPILSSGVYLAVLYAKMAAIGINSALANPEREALIQGWYQGLYADTYTDYLEMARYWYHGHRSVNGWMDRAQRALGEELESVFVESDRSAFIGLATGNAHAHPNYVPLRTLGDFPLPLSLRKDPRAHFHSEAKAMLIAHGARDVPEQSERREAETATFLASVPISKRKAVLETLRSDEAEYVERLTGDADLRLDEPLVFSPRARLSLEAQEDIVAMVLRAPSGERRVLRREEEQAISSFAEPCVPGTKRSRGGLVGERFEEFCRELAGARVLIPADEAARAEAKAP